MKLESNLFVLVLFLFHALLSCTSNSSTPDIYANHDVTVCGINDPLSNMEWLENIATENHSKLKAASISVYQNKETQESVFVYFKLFKEINSGALDTAIGTYSVYSCNGNLQFSQDVGGPLDPNTNMGKFLGEYELVVCIWSLEN